MHEYPVTVQIVDIASETARKNKGRVRRIDLVVGKDSGFIGESIQMYFDVVAEGTLCEGAKLVIEGVKPQLRCDHCGKLFERKRFKEFYVKSVELEVEDEPAADTNSTS